MSAMKTTPDPSEGRDCGLDEDDDSCWRCYGAGGFHNCYEDVCCCMDPGSLNEVCGECGGAGYIQTEANR